MAIYLDYSNDNLDFSFLDDNQILENIPILDCEIESGSTILSNTKEVDFLSFNPANTQLDSCTSFNREDKNIFQDNTPVIDHNHNDFSPNLLQLLLNPNVTISEGITEPSLDIFGKNTNENNESTNDILFNNECFTTMESLNDKNNSPQFNYRPHFEYFLEERQGRTRKWKITNHTPPFAHKSRRINVTAPLIGGPYRIEVSISLFAGKEEDKICRLLTAPTKYRSTPIHHTKLSYDVEAGNSMSCIVDINVDKKKKDCEAIYAINIRYAPIVKGTVTTFTNIHHWKLAIARSHKYESSKKGIAANFCNNVPKKIYV